MGRRAPPPYYTFQIDGTGSLNLRRGTSTITISTLDSGNVGVITVGDNTTAVFDEFAVSTLESAEANDAVNGARL